MLRNITRRGWESRHQPTHLPLVADGAIAQGRMADLPGEGLPEIVVK